MKTSIPIRSASQWRTVYPEIARHYLKRARQEVILRANHWEVT